MLFYKNKDKSVPGKWSIIGICPYCGEMHELTEDELLIRDVGYKGKIAVYIICNNCKKEVIVENDRIPLRIYRTLLKKSLF